LPVRGFELEKIDHISSAVTHNFPPVTYMVHHYKFLAVQINKIHMLVTCK